MRRLRILTWRNAAEVRSILHGIAFVPAGARPFAGMQQKINMFRLSWISIFSFTASLLLAALLIDHGTVGAKLRGPGLTLDESFNIQQGVYLVDALAQHGPLVFSPSGASKVFGSKDYLPDHPPLGRMVLGIAHFLTSWCVSGSESTIYNVPAARLGSCFAFAMTVLLLTEFCKRRYGWETAVCIPILMISTPSLIGHARLAALESTTNLGWVAALLPLLAWWTEPRPPSTLRACIAGVFWGLLLLTKVQGILLPPIVLLWAVWQYRWQCLRPLACWSVCGTVVFLVAWPWLWLDPIHNVRQYLGNAAVRLPLYCWYFGERFLDKQVPWHYPFVITLMTLPLGTLLSLLAALRFKKPDPVDQLLLLSIVVPLLVFALPGTPVYDGNRLFLIVMPLIVVFAARSACQLDDCLRKASDEGKSSYFRHYARWHVALLCLAVLHPLGTSTFSPYEISQYGPLADGTSGAGRLGMESSYWADGLNGDFWEQVPENSTVYVAPVSHQFQLQDIMSMVPIVQQRRINLVAYEYDPDKQKGLLLLIHRLADLRPELRTDPPGSQPVATTRQDGVVLARVIDTSP